MASRYAWPRRAGEPFVAVLGEGLQLRVATGVAAVCPIRSDLSTKAWTRRRCRRRRTRPSRPPRRSRGRSRREHGEPLEHRCRGRTTSRSSSRRPQRAFAGAGSAVREPPVRSRNRSVRRDAIWVDRKGAAAGRRQLDRQRQAVETRGDSARPAGTLGGLEATRRLLAPAHEEGHCVLGSASGGTGHTISPGTRRASRSSPPGAPGTALQQFLRQPRRPLDDVLTVVEDDDDLAIGDHVGERLRGRARRAPLRSQLVPRPDHRPAPARRGSRRRPMRRPPSLVPVPTRAGSCLHRPDRRG